MARARIEIGLCVVVRTLVLVFDGEGNGGSESIGEFSPRIDRDQILLVPL